MVRSSPASADLISALSARAGERLGRLKSTPSTGLCLLDDFQLPSGLKMSVRADRRTSRAWIASQPASPARTSPTWANAVKAGNPDCAGKKADSSLKSSASPARCNPLGWSLRTFRSCSLPMIAQTLRQSSGSLPTAGMWDSGECSMLRISESRKIAVASSLSAVLDASPHWSSWLMPRQWSQWLSRCLRAKSQGPRTAQLAIVLRLGTRQPGSTWVVSASSLKRTDGIRWFSGKENLRYMGFPADWMTGIGRRLSAQGTPLSRTLLNGLLKS